MSQFKTKLSHRKWKKPMSNRNVQWDDSECCVSCRSLPVCRSLPQHNIPEEHHLKTLHELVVLYLFQGFQQSGSLVLHTFSWLLFQLTQESSDCTNTHKHTPITHLKKIHQSQWNTDTQKVSRWTVKQKHWHKHTSVRCVHDFHITHTGDLLICLSP